MELEEAIKIYNELKKYKEIIGSIDTDFFFNFVETLLKECKNSIPKKKIEDKIKEYERVNKERGYLLVRESFVKKELQELLEDK